MTTFFRSRSDAAAYAAAASNSANRSASFFIRSSGFEIETDFTAIITDHQRGHARDGIVQRRRCAAVMTGKDHQDDGLTVHPQHARVVGDEWLPVPSLVGDAN